MDTNKSYQIIRVAKKYYELHMGQLEIAQEEGVSKSTISRMLQKAIDLGYVKVTIDAPVESVKEMEDQLKQTFHLKEVFVSPNLVDDEEINLRDTCRALAGNLDKYIIDNTVVAVSWGNTLNCLAGQIQPLKAKDIKVVQLNGGVAEVRKQYRCFTDCRCPYYGRTRYRLHVSGTSDCRFQAYIGDFAGRNAG